jgi:RNA polymerase sporulation-specific sigma factor
VSLIALAQSDDEDRAMEATARLIEINKGLVRSIAQRFRERGVEFEDLMQIGTVGMLKAIRSFDLSIGTSFSTYAVPLIFGEIRRHLRDEGPIKVGRYYKKLGATLMNERNRILSEEGRDARIEELAAFCSVSVEEASAAIDAISPVMSLSDNVYGEEGMTLENTIPDEEAMNDIERLFDRIALGQAVSKMPNMWQKIVLLRFYRDMTQQQTAQSLGLTQVKVSREEKKIFEFLRSEMLR